MTGFRVLLVAIFVAIAGYTVIVIANHGPNLFPVFFGSIAAFDWSGQFNVDFASFLVLSAVWLAWRHHFSVAGFVLGLCGFFLGGLFLSAYLLVASLRADGDVRIVLLGERRARV